MAWGQVARGWQRPIGSPRVDGNRSVSKWCALTALKGAELNFTFVPWRWSCRPWQLLRGGRQRATGAFRPWAWRPSPPRGASGRPPWGSGYALEEEGTSELHTLLHIEETPPPTDGWGALQPAARGNTASFWRSGVLKTSARGDGTACDGLHIYFA